MADIDRIEALTFDERTVISCTCCEFRRRVTFAAHIIVYYGPSLKSDNAVHLTYGSPQVCRTTRLAGVGAPENEVREGLFWCWAALKKDRN